ncbi:MAG: nitrogen regulation protein NR(II) [Phycisphaerae bacterium]
MAPVWWLIIGVVASGPLWALAALWVARRMWRSARRLAARARGQEHLVELGQLAGGLAHEIKNPLSTINLNLKLLAEDLGRYPDEDHRRWLRRLSSVQGEADRLKAILEDFLRYAGKIELTPAVVDLRTVVSEVADFFAPQATAGKVVMRTSLPDVPVRCNIDVNLIKQALLNLMINAVQAMPEGGDLLVKVLTTGAPKRGLSRLGRDRRDQAVLEVIDTGIGIPRPDLPRIFQAYYSTKSRGAGLGLPTTRRIIREHGGDIRVESEQGKGTRFVVSLPMAR